MSWPWSQLGLPGPSELSEVRHAYAEKLKTTHPEEDPEGFQRLHSAYQLASRMARQQKRQGARSPEPQMERPVPPPQPPKEEEDFDYDELLSGGGEQPRRPQEDEQDFDFDELLEEDGPAPHPPEVEEEQDFDFDRLFAEGEAERAEARRRRGEERRKAQRQQFQERQRQWKSREERLNFQFRQEEERWQGTETILHTIEMLYNSRAGAEEWKKFFASPLFRQNRNTMDLIFGLEDFVSARSLPQEVKLALFLAYNFDKGPGRPELRPLFQMLLPAWKAANQEKTRERYLAVLGLGLGVAFPFILVPLLDIGLVPALVSSLGVAWIFWVLRKVVKQGSQAKRARGEKVSKKQELRAMICGILAVVAVYFILSWARSSPELDWRNFLPTKDPREQTCRYIEKDFGLKVGSLYNLSDTYASDTYGNVFYLDGDPTNKRFLAGPNGERDGANTGYTTNLPEMMLRWQLKEFAKEHKLTSVDSLDQELERWETSGTYLITLPEEEGETVIEGLGALLEEFSGEKWYEALPSSCQIVLCSRELEEGRIVLIRVHPATEVYSVPQILGLYEDGFAHSVCAQILRELDLDWDFLREEGERYTLTMEGKARLKDRDCYKLYGLNGEGAAAIEYYVDLDQRNIYCVPGNFWETGNTEDQIGFYRLLHWGKRGTFGLYYPWLRVN